MISVNSDSLLLSGVHKKPDLNEMWFKSYGNVYNGKAFVSSIPISQLGSGDVTWTKEFGAYNTAKSAQVLPSGKIAVLLYGEDEALQASTALLDANGNAEWTTKHLQHGEATDLAVVDNEWIIITGHGGDGYKAGKLTKVKVSNGSSAWTKEFTVGGNPNLIYEECWGVIALPDGFIASCGAGIEGGRCSEVSGQEKIDCNAGRGDLRDGAYLRKQNNWQSFVLKTDLNGNLLWQRVDSYRCNDCISMDSASFNSLETGSSAAEWITKGEADGEFMVVTDEVFGVGALILTGEDSGSTPTNVPGPTTSPPTGSCIDDPIYKFTTDTNIKKTCGWLASKKQRRNKYCPRTIMNNGMVIKEACKSTCDNCNPFPTPAPDATSPTSNACKDSELKMIINNKGRTCKWAGKKNKRCKKKGVKSHCPKSCNSCSKACSDSEKMFIAYGDEWKCIQIEDDPEYYCNIEGVSSTCRETCEFCA